MKNVKILDCTLRDGAYITKGIFGDDSIKGIINKLVSAKIDVVECGWLKDDPHKLDSTYYHLPKDLCKYVKVKDKNIDYAAMIDWNRYNTDNLPKYDGEGINLIRVVFPYGKLKEGMEVGKRVSEKGYKLFFQAANTLVYNENDLKDLCEAINKSDATCIYMVDTFGAMFNDDVLRIASTIDKYLDKNIMVGFHAHNNMQLAFSNAMEFIKYFEKTDREIIIDGSLIGMGRGAGNATTELIANILNKKYNKHYDFDAIMAAIDLYMTYYKERYTWGYSTPYFIAGMYCCHVNNIAYLIDNHNTNAKDMRSVIESLPAADRTKYDYDLLEKKYIENQNKYVDDAKDIERLSEEFKDKKILLIAPGKSVIDNFDKIKEYINKEKPIVIGVNAILEKYVELYNHIFFINQYRYEYAKEIYKEKFDNINKIVLSNIKNEADKNEVILAYQRAIGRGYLHFDNAVISLFRLLDNIGIDSVSIAGFDGFKNKYNESYADEKLPSLNLDNKWDELNEEIIDMMKDFKMHAKSLKDIRFLTESKFNV